MEPEVFGRYRLMESLGRGGMAEVFLAKLEGIEGFERRLALKRIHPQFTTNPSFVQMFIDEARLAGRFNHPNVVQMFDFGKIDDTYYIAMEFVEGLTVAALMSHMKKTGRRLPIEAIVEIGIGVSQGMDYAHKETDENGEPLGIIHRDLTPHNILVSRKGTVKVTDFGIAKASMNTHMTQAGMIKGKVPYMSPEQAMGMPLDNRSDLFSIGINLFEMCALRRLFDGPSDFHVLQKVMAADIPPLRDINPDVPPDLEAVIRRCLTPKREDRYETAADIVRDLTRIKFSMGETFTHFRLSQFVSEVLEEKEGPKPAASGATVNTPAPVSAPTLAGARSAAPEDDGARTVLIPTPTPDHGVPQLKKENLGAAAQAAETTDEGDDVDQPTQYIQAPTQRPPSTVVLNGAGKDAGEKAPEAAATGKVDEKAAAPEVKVEEKPGKATAASPSRRSVLPLVATVLVLVLLGAGGAFWWFSSRPASLTVRPVPSMATVTVDGQKLAEGGPYSAAGLKPGAPVVVRVEMPGFFPREETLELKAGEARVLDVPLEGQEVAYAAVTLESDPPGAKVLLDGGETGWVTPCRLNLLPGQAYAVTLIKEGYQPEQRTLQPQSAGDLTERVSLTPTSP